MIYEDAVAREALMGMWKACRVILTGVFQQGP